MNQYITGNQFHKPFLSEIKNLYSDLGINVLSILSDDQKREDKPDINDLLERVILVSTEIRRELRQKKLWQLSDKIRDDFRQLGIEFVDNPDGSTSWKIK